MTHAEIRAQYTSSELNYTPGDRELRYRLFAPLLRNLWKDKVVYHEKFLAIVRIHKLEVDPQGFRRVAEPLYTMTGGVLPARCPNRPWDFGGKWEFVNLLGNCLWVTWAQFGMWTDPELVERVQSLVLGGNLQEAWKLTINEPVLPYKDSSKDAVTAFREVQPSSGEAAPP